MTIFLFTFAVLLMLFIPLGLAVWLRRRFAVPWLLFCLGMLAFVGSQTYHIPLNNWLTDLGVIGEVSPNAPNLWRTAVILGLSAGISETVARVLGYWFLFRRKLAERFEDGVLVGLGHGGIEAMIIGGIFLAGSLSSLWAIRNVDLTTLGMTAAEMTAVSEQLVAITETPWVVFAGVFERLIAITLHVTISVLVWRAFKTRQVWPMLLGAALHAFLDATAVYAAQFLDAIWIELILLAIALPGAIWLWRQWPAEATTVAGLSWKEELRLWGTAVAHELTLQWRTRRALVMVAVFVLFGLASPLIAKFTPELLQNTPGAEQFAGLIPEPTSADAVSQYIRNLTQFGFVLVILLGMGAVAGEKSNGTAAIILSKPLPRWAFLLSKFTAQGVIYFVALLLGTLATYYYTLVLFEPLAFGPFLFGGFLLWLWTLVYTAVTLLGSTLGKSTGGAAGLALLGAILLLILGSIPQAANFFPGALVGWASQLGLPGDVPFSGAALAANGVLILVFLVTAVALFERQEI
ncbi:YhfC family glutamic-type intramembrane protease [Candidatus Leptofilum sp.]|uniref:YhfC family glutamic-type intramembrane protease n=1 Tax=Candidatus Leptofilum sp. TaxID=3241576 RepID=UPI003B5CD6C6